MDAAAGGNQLQSVATHGIVKCASGGVVSWSVASRSPEKHIQRVSQVAGGCTGSSQGNIVDTRCCETAPVPFPFSVLESLES